MDATATTKELRSGINIIKNIDLLVLRFLPNSSNNTITHDVYKNSKAKVFKTRFKLNTQVDGRGVTNSMLNYC